MSAPGPPTANSAGKPSEITSKSYFSRGSASSLWPASMPAPIITAAQAISMKTRYLSEAAAFSGFSLSKRTSRKLGMVINCQKAKKNHIMSVVESTPYMPPTNSRKNG